MDKHVYMQSFCSKPCSIRVCQLCTQRFLTTVCIHTRIFSNNTLQIYETTKHFENGQNSVGILWWLICAMSYACFRAKSKKIAMRKPGTFTVWSVFMWRPYENMTDVRQKTRPKESVCPSVRPPARSSIRLSVGRLFALSSRKKSTLWTCRKSAFPALTPPPEVTTTYLLEVTGNPISLLMPYNVCLFNFSTH